MKESTVDVLSDKILHFVALNAVDFVCENAETFAQCLETEEEKAAFEELKAAREEHLAVQKMIEDFGDDFTVEKIGSTTFMYK